MMDGRSCFEIGCICPLYRRVSLCEVALWSQRKSKPPYENTDSMRATEYNTPETSSQNNLSCFIPPVNRAHPRRRNRVELGDRYPGSTSYLAMMMYHTQRDAENTSSVLQSRKSF